MNKKHVILLFFITGLALSLRLYKVSENPPALSWDEVSIGYNAYSILKTGKDEHGRRFPLDTFIAYGDYKPPLAIYITVPFVALFGLNELAVRLPSVLFGTATVLLVYLVAVELFQKSRFSAIWIGLATAVSVAMSPWHINLSRAGFEANIGLFFILLGIYVVFVARKQSFLWAFAGLPFVAAIYTFNSSRYFVPFIVVGLAAYCWRAMVNQKRNIFLGVILAIIATLPVLPHLFSKEARLRFVEVNIFSDLSVVEKANAQIEFDGNGIVAKVFHNRRIGYIRSFLMHYFDHFSAEFLFIKGDGNPKFSTQDVGQFYIIDVVFLLFGAYAMVTYFRREAALVTYWLATAIIPAAVARETPHALRILNSLPAWHLFIGLGLVVFLYETVKRHRMLIYAVLSIGYFLSAGYYLHNYYVHYPRIYSHEWQYGYKQAIEYVRLHEDTYQKIYLSESIERAYMYTLFYTRYDPEKYLKEKKSYVDAAGFYHVTGFGKYTFSTTAPSALEHNALYIFADSSPFKEATVLQKIPLLNGDTVLTVFTKG